MAKARGVDREGGGARGGTVAARRGGDGARRGARGGDAAVLERVRGICGALGDVERGLGGRRALGGVRGVDAVGVSTRRRGRRGGRRGDVVQAAARERER